MELTKTTNSKTSYGLSPAIREESCNHLYSQKKVRFYDFSCFHPFSEIENGRNQLTDQYALVRVTVSNEHLTRQYFQANKTGLRWLNILRV